MAGECGRTQAGWWLWQTRAETGVRAAPIVVQPPRAKDPPQVGLSERDQEVQALPPQRPEEPLADRVGLGSLDRGAEDPGAQRRHGGVESPRADTVAIMEDEPVGLRRREGLPDLSDPPGSGWMPRHLEGHEPPTGHLHHHKDGQPTE